MPLGFHETPQIAIFRTAPVVIWSVGTTQKHPGGGHAPVPITSGYIVCLAKVA
jgi:hypothetical protein